MKRKMILGVVLFLSLGLLVSASKKDEKKKKDQEKNLKETPAPVVLPSCSFSRIVVTPEKVDDPSVVVGSGQELKFSAQAYDSAGKPVSANLKWYFRDLPPAEKPDTRGGHKLIASGATATFQVSGLASGTFKIAAEAVDCVDPNGRPVRGVAEISVYPLPGEPSRCGPILVMYGEREVTNEKLLGFINFILRAEIYGPKNLKGYQIQFYLDDKKITPRRNLIYDKQMTPGMDQEAGYWNYMTVWLKPGDYSAHYELLKDKKPVCASTKTYFTAR